MLVILRDGKKLHGVLRSYDQFGEAPSRFIPDIVLIAAWK